MYNASSQQVTAFVAAYQKVVGWNYPLSVGERRKYLTVDRDHSGVFLIDRVTGRVYNVKGYGKRGTWIGTMDNLTTAYACTQRLAVVN